MDLILCHQTADFDALGAAVGLSCLKAGAKVVLTGGANPIVKDFLALHRDEFAPLEMRSVNTKLIRSLAVVDTQKRDRLGKASAWFDLPHLNAIEIYDHHLDTESDIPATSIVVEAVGSTTTLIAELLQLAKIELTPFEATVMALGIHVDTGSLTFDQTTVRDVRALAWLMEMGANVRVVSEYAEPTLSPQLQKLLQEALQKLATAIVRGYTIAWVLLETDRFVPGLSNLASSLRDLTECDLLLFGHQYARGKEGEDSSQEKNRLTVIGRSRLEQPNLDHIFHLFGGGGHSQAASLNLISDHPQKIFQELIDIAIAAIPHPPTARDLMSSPVRTIRPNTTIEQAQRILLRYGHSGLSVVDESDRLVGIISRRDLDLALHHGFSHAPVKGYMTKNLKTISLDTLLPEIESLMVTYDVGRLPVLQNDKLLGIVTRTDVLRQLYRDREAPRLWQDRTLTSEGLAEKPLTACLLPSFQELLAIPVWEFLQQAAQKAHKRGWHLYLVGGAVRDLLLGKDDQSLMLQDIDLVVDGFHRSADNGAGVELASTLQSQYPQSRLSIHGAFQTAALLWHNDDQLGSLCVDIATARTEFYPYPAANPEVEASSIRQDLYRRDFSINALALRLTPPREGELLDFFGGLLDLRSRQVRVLHANSFIEDPTRIYRAVRFAVKLAFTIEPQTEAYIRYAINSGIYERLRTQNRQAPALTTRLKAELQYILQAPYWRSALKLLADLKALHCLHSSLELDRQLWWQIRYVSFWLNVIDPENTLRHWLVRLETLIVYLNQSDRREIALSLQLPKDSTQRLTNFEQMETEIAPNLASLELPSQIVKFLNQYDPVSLIILAARSQQNCRRVIWQYLTHWSKLQPLLNGKDLQSLGYKPGPKFKQILEDLLTATLDGKIRDHAEAEDYVFRINRVDD